MSKEIKQKIDEYAAEIERLYDPTIFTLNQKVNELGKKIVELQNQCHHHFVDGQCEFCYRMEGNNE